MSFGARWKKTQPVRLAAPLESRLLIGLAPGLMRSDQGRNQASTVNGSLASGLLSASQGRSVVEVPLR